ncbi:hypothetical protein F4780DRAFT_429841 [Xylariomycetidae sp. FL0641]|nr:hypothetical protein F4780DRAFT_429841 [Xylariomycetidae sp. FL0641]
MSDQRYRYPGRRSPTYNPARASLPVNFGYNAHYNGELHAVPATRTSVPRRTHDSSGTQSPATTITTYNVTKDPYNATKDPGVQRSASHAGRRRSTMDTNTPKPIIVTTNHPSRSHASSSSHASSNPRTASPSRDPYRSSDETYYALPASSHRARSQHRHSASYGQGATIGDDWYRFREPAGDGRLRVPARVATDSLRLSAVDPVHHARPHSLYPHTASPVTAASPANSALVDIDSDYTHIGPGDLARYDLDHGRDQRRSRRDSIDRPYYRPHVNVASNEPSRYEPRSRARPPVSAGLDRYNRAAAAGSYDRPTVTMPALSVMPPAPPADSPRRTVGTEGPRSPSVDRRSSRPRPVSLYQDPPFRPSHPDELYRPREEERAHKGRRERDAEYRDDAIAARGFGLRTDSIEQPISRPASATTQREYDDRRSRQETKDRDPNRRSDESLDRETAYERPSVDDAPTRVESSRDGKDGLKRRNSVGRARDKVSSGLGVAAAALGLGPKKEESQVPPQRRGSDDEKEPSGSRAVEKYRSRERDVSEARSPVRSDSVAAESRREYREPYDREPYEREIHDQEPRGYRESKRERAESVSNSKEREIEKEREREKQRELEHREWERERERDRDREREKEWEREQARDAERSRERQRRDTEAKLTGAGSDTREESPPPNNAASAPPKRRRPSTAFNPTDTKGLMELKAELAARDNQEKPAEKPTEKPIPKDNTLGREIATSNGSASPSPESRDQSRGRELVPAREEKQVRVLSPPRDSSEPKPLKGILKPPKERFPEDDNPVREGVAPHKDDKTKKGIPPGARWTSIKRALVNPEALTIGKERFEVRDDHVIVLRVLNKEEIQAYADATKQLRDMRRKEYEKEMEGKQDRYSNEERSHSDEERQRRHRHRREREEEEYEGDRYREDRHRRHRLGSDEDEYESRARQSEYDVSSSHHGHRSRRDYDSATTYSDDRR